jgi:DNA repair protein RecN (Recombination protein N)
MISANPGEEPWPLEKIASGGELSRVMLALRTVLAVDRAQKTLVFDEVDAGIGGKAAETVGRKLKELSTRYQIFCVTHLAQIAAFADHQYRIEKHVIDGRSVTRVESLRGEDRVEELVRMMSGSRVTDAARQHVKELLKAVSAG